MISLYLRLLSRFSIPLSPSLSFLSIFVLFASITLCPSLLIRRSFSTSYSLPPPPSPLLIFSRHPRTMRDSPALLCAVTFPLALPAVINLQNRITSPLLSLFPPPEFALPPSMGYSAELRQLAVFIFARDSCLHVDPVSSRFSFFLISPV